MWPDINLCILFLFSRNNTKEKSVFVQLCVYAARKKHAVSEIDTKEKKTVPRTKSPYSALLPCLLRSNISPKQIFPLIILFSNLGELVLFNTHTNAGASSYTYVFRTTFLSQTARSPPSLEFSISIYGNHRILRAFPKNPVRKINKHLGVCFACMIEQFAGFRLFEKIRVSARTRFSKGTL